MFWDVWYVPSKQFPFHLLIYIYSNSNIKIHYLVWFILEISLFYSIYCLITSKTLFFWLIQQLCHTFNAVWIVPKDNTKLRVFVCQLLSFLICSWFRLFSKIGFYVCCVFLYDLKCWQWMPNALHFGPQPLSLCREPQWTCGLGVLITNYAGHLLELKMRM